MMWDQNVPWIKTRENATKCGEQNERVEAAPVIENNLATSDNDYDQRNNAKCCLSTKVDKISFMSVHSIPWKTRME